ncbi:hypothetical protein MVES1_000314 [Malassezia vespertilionis]|nr:uncharacterized protein MVES1_000314 [Malassezia vespertilionis]WFD04989.1 hypothetical protein MVES1_000314 [Malassezia vespertilionis]
MDAAYPCNPGIDKQCVAPNTDGSLAAQQMLPDRMHNHEEDWTLLVRRVSDLDGLSSRPKRPTHVLSSDTCRDGTSTMIYILNYARSMHGDDQVRGGAIWSIALGTMHPHVSMFKPLLVLAMKAYLDSRCHAVLETLFHAANSLDLTQLPCLTRAEKLLLRTPVLDPGMPRSARRAPSAPMPQHTPHGWSKRSRVKVHSMRISDPSPQHACKTHYSTKFVYDRMSIPVHVPLALFPDELGEYSLTNLLTLVSQGSTPRTTLHPHLHTNGTHTHPVVLLFNALITNKRVLFVGYRTEAHTVVDFVLAACALASGSGAILRGFLDQTIPYATLADLDALNKMDGFIAGVTNPRFEQLPVWDVMCNVDTGKISLGKHIIPASTFSPRCTFVPHKGKHGSAYGAQDDMHAIWSTGDVRANSADGQFVQQLLSKIKAHASEASVRWTWQMYVNIFVCNAARHELRFYGDTLLAVTSQDVTWGDEISTLRANAMRAEGWRTSPSYQMYIRDVTYDRRLARNCEEACAID